MPVVLFSLESHVFRFYSVKKRYLKVIVILSHSLGAFIEIQTHTEGFSHLS